MSMSKAQREQLKILASDARSPAMVDAQNEILMMRNWAAHLHREGVITKRELDDVVARSWERAIEHSDVYDPDALSDMQAMAGHDGTRDDYGVRKDRDAVELKLRRLALDAAYDDGRIDDKKYAEMQRKHIGKIDDKIDDMLADGDFDGAAAETFLSRFDEPRDHHTNLDNYLSSKYGDGKQKSQRSASKPKGDSRQDADLSRYLDKTYGKQRASFLDQAEHDADAGADASDDRPSWKGEARPNITPWDYEGEPPEPDANGIIDWDAA